MGLPISCCSCGNIFMDNDVKIRECEQCKGEYQKHYDAIKTGIICKGKGCNVEILRTSTNAISELCAKCSEDRSKLLSKVSGQHRRYLKLIKVGRILKNKVVAKR